MWDTILKTFDEVVRRRLADSYAVLKAMEANAMFQFVAVSPHDSGAPFLALPSKRSKYKTQRSRDKLVDDLNLDTVRKAAVDVEGMGRLFDRYMQTRQELFPNGLPMATGVSREALVESVEGELQRHADAKQKKADYRAQLAVSRGKKTSTKRKAPAPPVLEALPFDLPADDAPIRIVLDGPPPVRRRREDEEEDIYRDAEMGRLPGNTAQGDEDDGDNDNDDDDDDDDNGDEEDGEEEDFSLDDDDE
jgi:hypothetical protein